MTMSDDSNMTFYDEFNMTFYDESNMTFYDESNMTFYDDSNKALYEWWNTLGKHMMESIDDIWNETNMTSYGEDLEVQDYEIVDFYDRNTTVSDFS